MESDYNDVHVGSLRGLSTIYRLTDHDRVMVAQISPKNLPAGPLNRGISAVSVEKDFWLD